MSGVEDNGHDSGHGETDAIDPNVWSGRASQENFVDLSA